MKPAEYDAWYDADRGRWIGETEYRLINNLLALAPGSSALDVGCGTGWFTRRLAADGFEMVGVDLDSEALDYAQQRANALRSMSWATLASSLLLAVPLTA